MKFRDFFSIKHMLFAVAVLALFVVFGIIASNTQVEVTFDTESVYVDSKRYSISIPYEMVSEAELQDLPEAGEKIQDAVDDDSIRYGRWTNDAWGEHDIIVDLDSESCIVCHLTDGRIFVFGAKNDEKTRETYETLQTYLQG